jgi:hypothetical protein
LIKTAEQAQCEAIRALKPARQQSYEVDAIILHVQMQTFSLTLLFAMALSLSLAYSEDKYVYVGLFNGTPKDDGTNNVEIKKMLFENLKIQIELLKSEAIKSNLKTDTALVLKSMLELHAFCHQRSDHIHLTRSQTEQVQIISQTLKSLNLSYHQNEQQSLMDLCAHNPALVDKVKLLLELNSFKQ